MMENQAVLTEKSEHEPASDLQRMADAYCGSTISLRSIARLVGVSHTAVAKHARRHGWRRPPERAARQNSLGVTTLAAAMEVQLAGIDGVSERYRRFVAAMIQLDASPARIADILDVSETALQAEFGECFAPPKTGI